MQERVHGEAKAMLDAAQRECRATLERHRTVLDALSTALLKEETVSCALLGAMLPIHRGEAANDVVLRRVAMEPTTMVV